MKTQGRQRKLDQTDTTMKFHLTVYICFKGVVASHLHNHLHNSTYLNSEARDVTKTLSDISHAWLDESPHLILAGNEVAHQLLLNGSVKKDRKQAKHIQKQQRAALSDCPETSNLSQSFTTDEIINALKATKAGKAAGPDGIFPDMLKNIGPAAVRWLQAFYDDVMTTAKIPKIWRSANVIAIRKPGKPIDEPTSYRPISLLCCCYKLLERLLLTRLSPIFECVIPPEQAGFRKKRNTCDQVLALTSYIESGFQKKLKTGAVLIDLSAAYDTVWQAGLLMKLSKAIKCRTTIRLIASLISQRNFRVFLGNQVSRKRILKNGLPPRIRTCAVVL